MFSICLKLHREANRITFWGGPAFLTGQRGYLNRIVSIVQKRLQNIPRYIDRPFRGSVSVLALDLKRTGSVSFGGSLRSFGWLLSSLFYSMGFLNFLPISILVSFLLVSVLRNVRRISYSWNLFDFHNRKVVLPFSLFLLELWALS